MEIFYKSIEILFDKIVIKIKILFNKLTYSVLIHSEEMKLCCMSRSRRCWCQCLGQEQEQQAKKEWIIVKKCGIGLRNNKLKVNKKKKNFVEESELRWGEIISG